MTATLETPTMATKDVEDTTRSYLDIVNKGKYFETIKTQCPTSQEWQQIRHQRNKVFVDSCMTITQLDSTLETHLRDRLLKLRFHVFPAKEGAKFLKLSPDVREKCLAQLEEIQLQTGFLCEEILSGAIAQHRPVPKNKVGFEDTLDREMIAKILNKLGLEASLQASLEQQLHQNQTPNGEVLGTDFINVCYGKGIKFEQIRKILLSKEYTDWVEDKAIHYKDKSLQLLNELDRTQQEAINFKQERDRLQQERTELIQEIKSVKQQLTANKARTAQQEETKSYKSHHPASIQTPQPVTKYHKGARVGIVKDGQIINEGVMIGQPTDGQIRVRFDTGGSDLFVFDDLMLLSLPNPPKTGEKTRKKPKGFGC